MKDLKCGLKICRHNKGYCCCAKSIEVGKNTDCKTFSPDKRNLSMFEAGNDFIASNYSVDTKVACKADCLFQHEYKCIANGITVMSDADSDVACLTFVKN